MDSVPEVIATASTTWRVRRAWPADDTVSFEATDSRRLIGGRWDPRAGASLIDPRRDRRLPGVARMGEATTLVSYRPGKRAVAHDPGGATYTKIVRPGRAERILDGVDRGAAFTPAFETPEIRSHTDDTVTFAALSGHTLHDLAPQVDPDTWRRIWDAWSRAWISAVSRDSPGPVHSPEDEAEVLRTWIGHARRLLGPDPALDSVAAPVIEALTAGPAEPLVPAHRDLHDKQLLWDDTGRFGLLDVDTACRAEAALDLGNLRAHALLRGLQGLYSPGYVRTVRETIDRTATELGVGAERLALYEQAATLRLGCVYAFRPAWRDLAATLRTFR